VGEWDRGGITGLWGKLERGCSGWEGGFLCKRGGGCTPFVGWGGGGWGGGVCGLSPVCGRERGKADVCKKG